MTRSRTFTVLALLGIATASLFGVHEAHAGVFDVFGNYYCVWVQTAYGPACL